MVEFEVRSVRRSPPGHSQAQGETEALAHDAHAILSCPRCYGVFTLTHAGESRVLFGTCEYCDVEGVANLQ